jgi:hypothetical protein
MIMSKKDFEKQFNDLKNKHGFFWELSCFFFVWADILIYKNETDESPLLVIGIHDEDEREAGIRALEKIFEATKQ